MVSSEPGIISSIPGMVTSVVACVDGVVAGFVVLGGVVVALVVFVVMSVTLALQPQPVNNPRVRASTHPMMVIFFIISSLILIPKLVFPVSASLDM